MPAGDSPQPSPPRPAVTARDVLKALSEVRRRGPWPLLQDLETAEPDLAEFVMEEISAIHHTLLESGARPRVVRRLQRQTQSLVRVCVMVLRHYGDSGGDTGPAPRQGWQHTTPPP